MRFSYTAADTTSGSMMPRLSLVLRYRGQAVVANGLLDTGATVNVLPYSVGLALGAIWDDEAPVLPLAGNLGPAKAQTLIVSASHPMITRVAPVRLAFAWTERDDVPLIFGQVNFFLEFDVCFYRARGEFDVRRRGDLP